MEGMAIQWQQMQQAFRQGYMLIFRECYYASGVYALDPTVSHPLFVERMFPHQYAKDKLIRQLNSMGVRYQLLPSHPNN